MKVKIYGNGWVGKSVKKLFPAAIVVDPRLMTYPETRYFPADVAFVCVPTPSNGRSLDCSIVRQVVDDADEALIVVRSTVMPGFCGSFGDRRIVYQPEYLGETVNDPLFNESQVPFMVLGGDPVDRRKVIELYQGVYAANIKIRQVTHYEAEIIKLSENRAIAFKVAQCQELFDACEAAGVDYNIIREAVLGDDPRFNLWFSFVYPEKRGFNSKCLPKDVMAWSAWAESVGIDPVLTKAMLAYNDTLIRDQVRQ